MMIDISPTMANPIILTLISSVSPSVEALKLYILSKIENMFRFWFYNQFNYLSRFSESFLSGKSSNSRSSNPDWMSTLIFMGYLSEFLKQIEYVEDTDASLCTFRDW